MRKRGLICLLIVLALTFTACGKKETPASTPTPDSETEIETSEVESEVSEDDSWLAQSKVR